MPLQRNEIPRLKAHKARLSIMFTSYFNSEKYRYSRLSNRAKQKSTRAAEMGRLRVFWYYNASENTEEAP